jgi:PAS domain S-box-containing protein
MSTQERTSILLVDDRPANLIALQAMLDRPDYDLIVARSGSEALALIPQHDFAVIVLDVAMPDMDGFATASEIKKSPEHRTVPIIFVTAVHEDLGWIYRAYDVGAVDFLQKPLDPHTVRAKVAFFVELHLQRRQIERQERQLREQQRALHELHFRNLADAIPHIVWVASSCGELEYVSDRWEACTGRPMGQALGRGWLMAVAAGDRPRARQMWEDCIAAGVRFEFELPLLDAQGTPHWHIVRGLPEHDARGQLLRWVGTLTDVEEQRRLREELAANVQLRDEFIQAAAHELRTPLTALTLRLGSLERHPGDAPEEIEHSVHLARRQTDRLSRLVERLLDVSRLQSGPMQLQLEPCDLAQIARDAVERTSAEFARTACALDTDIPESLPGTWDGLRIEQVLVNLLSNASKYGARKPVGLVIDADATTARIVVRDHGIGIPPEAMGRIFGRFQRAISSQHYGGLGLGLYLVAQIVEAHGGTVRADSRPDQGTIVTVELPRHAAAAAPAGHRSAG